MKPMNQLPILNRTGQEIEKHWREMRPIMVADLEKSGNLLEVVFEAQESLLEMAHDLIFRDKMDPAIAFRLAREEYMLMPDEEDQQNLAEPMTPYD